MSFEKIINATVDERISRTWIRRVYNKFLDYRIEVNGAKQVGVDVGLSGELDLEAILADLVKIGELESRSVREGQGALSVDAEVVPDDDEM